MITLPIWAIYAVAFGTSVMTLFGVLLGRYIMRTGAAGLETRSRREETIPNLREPRN